MKDECEENTLSLQPNFLRPSATIPRISLTGEGRSGESAVATGHFPGGLEDGLDKPAMVRRGQKLPLLFVS